MAFPSEEAEKYSLDITQEEDAASTEPAQNTRLTEEDVPLEQRRMEKRIMRKVDWRLIPILGLLYSVAGLDRVNVRAYPFRTQWEA